VVRPAARECFALRNVPDSAAPGNHSIEPAIHRPHAHREAVGGDTSISIPHHSHALPGGVMVGIAH
jgi:hypothetical protein